MKIKNQIKPNFIIIGAPKSGSTSLYFMLKQHPSIFMPDMKEPNFFSRNRNMDEYDYCQLFKSATEGKVGEASINYLSDPTSPGLIRESLDEGVKLIAILRNPVEQVQSHFYHRVSRGYEKPGNINKILNESDSSYDYLFQAYYGEQLQRYLNYFDKKQIMVVLADSFFNNPVGIVKEIFDFLDIEVLSVLPEKRNAHGAARFPVLHSLMNKRSVIKSVVAKILSSNIKGKIKESIRDFNNIEQKYPEVSSNFHNEITNAFRADVQLLDKMFPELDVTYYWKNFS